MAKDSLRAVPVYFMRVVHHWSSLMTGGALMAALGLYEHLADRQVPSSLYVGIAFFSIFVACYFAWLEEHRLLLEKDAQLNKANTAVVSLGLSQQNARIDRLQPENSELISKIRKICSELPSFSPLTEEEEDRLRLVLSSVPDTNRFPVTIYYAQLGGEPAFARRISALFSASGWKSEVRLYGILNPQIKGIRF